MKMQELEHLASEERMIPGAPVHTSRTVAIHAPLEEVWHLQTDVDRWAHWYSYLRGAKLVGPFGPGAKLTYGGFAKHNLVIAKVEEKRLVMVYGKYMGFSGVTQWRFQPLSQSETQVTFEESSTGLLMSVLYSNEKLGEHLGRWLEQLKLQAETPWTA